MTAPLCEAYPTLCATHGATRWHHIVITIVITVTVAGCAGMSPEWLTAIAALLAATASK